MQNSIKQYQTSVQKPTQNIFQNLSKTFPNTSPKPIIKPIQKPIKKPLQQFVFLGIPKTAKTIYIYTRKTQKIKQILEATWSDIGTGSAFNR